MDNNFKYWLEENKDKFYIGGAIVALVGIVLGGYFVLNKGSNNNLDGSIKYTMADYILNQNEDGLIELYETDDGKLLDSVESSVETISFTDDNMETTYLYSDDKISTVSINGSDKIELTDKLDVKDIENVVKVRTNGDKFGLLTDDELIILDNEGKTLLIHDDNPTDVFQLADDGVYMSVDNEIHYIKYDDGSTEYVDIGDITTKITSHGNSIIARNNFGSGKNTESIINIKKDGLFINNLKRVQHENKIDLNVPSNENHISLIQYSLSPNDKITKQELVSVAIDNTKDDSDSADLVVGKDSSVELDTTEPFTPQVKSIKGFIYDTTEDGLRIIETNNGREAKRLPIKEITNYFPMFK